MYKLYYNVALPVDRLSPGLSLDTCLAGANSGNVSYQTKLVRLNWMIKDLRYNKIQKPFLVDENFKIITGDTRYMAIQFYSKIAHVPCLMTARSCPYSNWVPVKDNQELGKLVNIPPESILTNHSWQDRPLDWIEFAYDHTINHMHDEEQRKRMIHRYLIEHPHTVFNYDWLRSNIDWSLYDH